MRLFLSICTLMMVSLIFVPSVKADAQKKTGALLLLEEKGHKADYLGSAYGLDGWVITGPDGSVQYGYSSPEGGLVMGMLVAPDGSVHTVKQVEQMRDIIKGNSQAAAPIAQDEQSRDKLSKAEIVYASIEAANWFAVGDENAPYIYTFVNISCTHCKDFWKDHLKEPVKKGQVQVRFIPFGESDENKNAAARLLSSDFAALAWDAYASGNPEGLDIMSKEITEEGLKKVQENNDVFSRWGLPIVPFTMYRAPANSEIKVMSGVPSNIMILLADMLK